MKTGVSLLSTTAHEDLDFKQKAALVDTFGAEITEAVLELPKWQAIDRLFKRMDSPATMQQHFAEGRIDLLLKQAEQVSRLSYLVGNLRKAIESGAHAARVRPVGGGIRLLPKLSVEGIINSLVDFESREQSLSADEWTATQNVIKQYTNAQY